MMNPFSGIHLLGRAVTSVVTTPLVPPRTVSRNISVNDDHVAVHAEVIATWLGDDIYASIGSIATGTLTGMPLTHWFIAIETNDPNVWYWAEHNISAQTLKRCHSRKEVK
jgi:hypothetical protein